MGAADVVGSCLFFEKCEKQRMFPASLISYHKNPFYAISEGHNLVIFFLFVMCRVLRGFVGVNETEKRENAAKNAPKWSVCLKGEVVCDFVW